MKNNKFITKFLLVFMMVISIITANVEASEAVVNSETSDEVMDISNEDATTAVVESKETIFDVDVSTGAYKYSDSNDIYLPFIRYSADRILIDKNLNGLGASFSGSSIEVNSDVEGVQVLFANDSIRVNNKMEYGVLFASTNTTISSTIEKSLIVFSGEKITISEEAVIKGDIICFGTDIEINGAVEGSVIGFASNVVVNGTINKDLRVETNNITLGEESVKGNLYVETYNNALTLPEVYSDAIIKVIEVNTEFDYSIITNGIITALVFTLVYLMLNKITKNKMLENSVDKIKSNPVVLVLGGTFSLMTIPVITIILVILSAVGLYMITIPVIIIYIAFLLVAALLSTLVVGMLMTEYMSNTKYLKDKGNKTKYVFAFVMFAILYALARVPYIGSYVTVALVIISTGSLLCLLFCKNNKELKENKIVENK